MFGIFCLNIGGKGNTFFCINKIKGLNLSEIKEKQKDC